MPTLSDAELLRQFDEVMRDPASARGLDAMETARLLAERCKRLVPASEYAETMERFQQLYFDQFVNTSSIDLDFPRKIREAIQRYL